MIIARFLLSLLLLLGSAVPALSQEGTRDIGDKDAFAAWLADFRLAARDEGISAKTLDAALTGIEPIPRVVELDRRQPEFTQTFEEYITARVSETRIAKGREKLARHATELSSVSETYGVPAPIIAAIWGMETNYGDYLGSFPVIASLVTLSYDGRRESFFTRQLVSALKIIDQGHVTADTMKGSWAGAMGQTQFMPSSFIHFAVDFSGDGRADIWGTEADVFASIANYLAENGWRDGHGWGHPVTLPDAVSEDYESLMPENPPASCKRALDDHTVQKPLDAWQAMGLTTAEGAPIDGGAVLGSLVRPGEGATPVYLTYRNFRAILRYNCSNFYALAVGLLADAIAAPPAVPEEESSPAPESQPVMTPTED